MSEAENFTKMSCQKTVWKTESRDQNTMHDSQRRDICAFFLRLEIEQISPRFVAISLLNDTEAWRKRQISTGEIKKKSSGDSAPKLQISVPSRGRTRPKLRGPAAILFISRDTCSDSIAKLFRACFCGVSHNFRAICCKMGYRTDVPV